MAKVYFNPALTTSPQGHVEAPHVSWLPWGCPHQLCVYSSILRHWLVIRSLQPWDFPAADCTIPIIIVSVSWIIYSLFLHLHSSTILGRTILKLFIKPTLFDYKVFTNFALLVAYHVHNKSNIFLVPSKLKIYIFDTLRVVMYYNNWTAWGSFYNRLQNNIHGVCKT